MNGEAKNGYGKGPEIDFSISVHVASNGAVTMAGGKHDGFPSYEVWAYSGDGTATQVYNHDQGWFPELVGKGDVRVPDERSKE